MASFNPYPGMTLRVGVTGYEFLSYRFFPDDDPQVFMIEGQESFIYSLRNPENNTLWAIKVFKPNYRGEFIARSTAEIFRYKNAPGFLLGHRICLTKAEYGSLLTKYPDLEYAVIMPWLAWKTWAGLIRSPEVSAQYTRPQALRLAIATARALWELERHGWAHTDIAGGNIMYSSDFTRIELLDFEGIYVPGAPAPRRLSYGSPGYQHQKLGRRGQYVASGDRFAGAILLAEMLSWWNPLIRAQTPTDAMTLFRSAELQTTNNARWQAVRDVLYSLSPDVLEFFDQAWFSSSLTRCPDFGAWLACLKGIKI